MNTTDESDTGLWQVLLGDGRFLLALTGVALAASGGFALFLCVSRHFLPHDVVALGVDADGLARKANRALVDFMFHDRAAFGGSLVTVGSLYLWLVGFPLRRGEVWAWWTLAVSGILGFASFLFYLGYGYLDTWHGVATLFLLPIFVLGLWRAHQFLPSAKRQESLNLKTLHFDKAERWPRLLLLAYAAGLVLAGGTISTLGMTRVFVGTDLAFIGMSRVEICGVTPALVPVIAHDRAGFGGGLVSTGVIIAMIVMNARLSRSLVQILALSGVTGFGAAIGVHYVIGYTNPWHLAPAWTGAILWLCGSAAAWRTVSLRDRTKIRVSGPTSSSRSA